MESFHPGPCSSRLLSAVCSRSRQKHEHLEETGEEQEGRFAWDADPQVGGAPAPATEAAREEAPPHPQTLAGTCAPARAPSAAAGERGITGVRARVGWRRVRRRARGRGTGHALAVAQEGRVPCCLELCAFI